MAHITLKEHAEAPIERVFDLLTDVKRWPEFMAYAMEVQEVTGPPDTAGTRIKGISTFLGRRMEGWDEVVEAERPRLWKLAGESAGMKYTATYRLTPAGQGTDVEVASDYDLPAGFLGGIADKLFVERTMERQMRHTAENFKALVEAEARVPA